MKHINRTIGYTCVAIAVFFGISISHTHAATEFITSWQTKIYAPSWYEGKIFPTHQSFITVGFELIEDGKIVDLSKTAIRWYVDDKLFKNEDNGLGIRQLTVYNDKYGGDATDIKIALPSYEGRVLEKTINIPIKNPEIVIDIPYFGRKILRGENTIYAWPFFFNTIAADALSLQWRVDGGDAQEGQLNEPLILNVGNTIGTGVLSEIGAGVDNQSRRGEQAVKSVTVETL